VQHFTNRAGRRLAGAMLLLAAALPAAAQAAETVRVRGTIEAFDGRVLSVKSREGSTVAIKLGEGWTVSGLKRASLDDIKPGTFVGAAAAGGGAGPLQAVEVLIFPPGVKSGEGHRDWDLMPESTMTNATVASTVGSVQGSTITVTYPGGEKSIKISPETTIVAAAPAEKSDLKPGAAVFVPAERGDDKTLTAQRIIVGNNGVAPPM
jgi:hypothetical protein